MSYYIDALKNYVNFKGRATRKQFWMFVLFNFIISTVLGFIDQAAGLTLQGSGQGILGGIYSLAVILPTLAISARRLHDIGKSGWMQLVALIPIAGIIWLIVLWATDTKPAGDKYGAGSKPAAPGTPAA